MRKANKGSLVIQTTTVVEGIQMTIKGRVSAERENGTWIAHLDSEVELTGISARHRFFWIFVVGESDFPHVRDVCNYCMATFTCRMRRSVTDADNIADGE
jgi:predicted chitinase